MSQLKAKQNLLRNEKKNSTEENDPEIYSEKRIPRKRKIFSPPNNKKGAPLNTKKTAVSTAKYVKDEASGSRSGAKVDLKNVPRKIANSRVLPKVRVIFIIKKACQ